MIRLHFTRGSGVVPTVIRWITWSEVNHVGIEIHGYVYESNHKDGVTCKPVARWLSDVDLVTSKEITGIDIDVVYGRLVHELHKPYDWLNILCYPFRCDYQHKNRWTCSELVAYAIQELVPHQHFHRVAPRHLLGIAHGNAAGR